MVAVCKANSRRIELLANAEVILADKSQFEFDLLCLIDDEVYWFEAKSGAYQKTAAKYGQMAAKRLALPPDRAFMVLAEVDSRTSDDLGRVIGMRVVDVAGLLPTLREELGIVAPLTAGMQAVSVGAG